MPTDAPTTYFRLVRDSKMESLQCHVYEYTHLKTGAQHIHIETDSAENVFMVAFRTFPEDSRGAAHILEHTALCGSEKYPVRDPFFLMIRRSLNTFMNAFTSSDWTAYPFATQNRQDFDNLLSVYLDAAFFPRLHALDFAQEGIRVEFESKEDPASNLVYKGVVFNEMKGAMSSPSSMLYRTLFHYLCPNTTYHHNSGGDPEHIPDLTYDQLLAFHRQHYHPSNAVFFTFGNIDAQTHQAVFEQNVLSRFERSPGELMVSLNRRYAAPLNVETSYAYEGKDMKKQTHHVMGWLWDESIDAQKKLECQLLKDILLDNSASPLKHALETYPHASNLSPLCFLEDGHREMSFVCGVEGSESEYAADFEQYLMNTLSQLAETGIDSSHVEAMLHQFELKQREITGDRYPFGLQILLEMLPTAIHRGDIFATLDLESSLAQLRKTFASPDFIKNSIKRLFLDNPHRVRLTLKPSDKMGTIRTDAEKMRLAHIQQSLTPEDKKTIIETAVSLQKRQEQKDDENILPKVHLKDVAKKGIYCSPYQSESKAYAAREVVQTNYQANTNGIAYHQLVFELPKLSPDMIQLLPLYTELLTEVGIGQQSYLETQAYQSTVCGGVSATTRIRANTDQTQSASAYFLLSSKCLSRNFEKTCDLMEKTLKSVRFDELKRIQELITQSRYDAEESIVGSGHSYAMECAASQVSSMSALDYRLSGMKGIQILKKMDESFSELCHLEALIEQLKELHKKIIQSPFQTLIIADAHHLDTHYQQHQAFLDFPWNNQPSTFELPSLLNTTESCWLVNAQVNYCAKAFSGVAQSHPDASALTILGPYLKNTFLHRAIREQGGAYGGGAGYDSSNGVFRFYSYRDPRLVETLKDFDRSIEFLLGEKQNPEHLEQAILGVMADIDKPKSPAREAFQDYLSTLQGRTHTFRQQLRERILNVTLADLQRVAKTYLCQNGKIAVLTNELQYEKVKDQLSLQAVHL